MKAHPGLFRRFRDHMRPSSQLRFPIAHAMSLSSFVFVKGSRAGQRSAIQCRFHVAPDRPPESRDAKLSAVSLTGKPVAMGRDALGFGGRTGGGFGGF